MTANCMTARAQMCWEISDQFQIYCTSRKYCSVVELEALAVTDAEVAITPEQQLCRPDWNILDRT